MINSVRQGGAGWLAAFVAIWVLAGTAAAQIPPGYYDTVDETNSTTLRSTLHAVIDDHQRFPYTSGSTDTWNILEAAQEEPGNSGSFLDVYRNRSFVAVSAGNSLYNREHTWPKSYGFPDDGSTNYPYTDCHMLRLCDDGYNSSRSNKPFRYCNAGCGENATDANNGQGGGSGTYAGNSNWTSGSFTSGTWEVWIGRRGDIARAMFYADLRYEGGLHNVTFVSEPDLILTDNETLIDNSNTGSNESVAYMGMLSVLLQWHVEDPVDAYEQQHNDTVYGFQGNRNPFVDHPEWVDCLFNNLCGPPAPPADPTGLVAVASDGQVDLSWDANGEVNFDGYNIYRSTVMGGPYSQLNGPLLRTPVYSDTAVSNGTTYFYVVTAVNTIPLESGNSLEVQATPEAPQPFTGPWINEFHYHNTGPDTGELIEVAGLAGTDLTGWSIVKYNGADGLMYGTINLSGVLPDLEGCIGALSFDVSPLQNGPDGFALIAPGSVVQQFLSYEGIFAAADGPALGETSEEVPFTESSLTSAGQSLQLGGTGSTYTDFAWQPSQAETPDDVNTGQTFTGDCFATYCTAGTSASGCQATLSGTGTPSATAVSGFDLSATDVEGNKDGLFFFSSNGRQANAWGNGTSFQCVAPPVKRAGLLAGNGTNGACDAVFTQDINTLWNTFPAKNPGAGAVVQAQLWYRDPFNTSNQTTSLSDAIEFAVAP